MVNFTASPLIPAVAQDARTGQVLMLAYMNQESLRRTLETGQVWFWSRSRGELWHKGATSGHYLNVRSVTGDCDSDAILLRVEPEGPACHTGAVSCFFNEITSTAGEGQLDGLPDSPLPDVEEAHPMEQLFATIEDRKAQKPEGSYVAGLLSQGAERVAKKVVEEAGETAIAAVSQSDQRVIEEVADLWFHSLILLSALGLSPAQVWGELEARRR